MKKDTCAKVKVNPSNHPYIITSLPCMPACLYPNKQSNTSYVYIIVHQYRKCLSTSKAPMLNKTMRSLPFRCFACIVSSLEIKHHMFETKTVRATSVSQFLEIPWKPASSHLHYSPLKHNLSESFHPKFYREKMA